MGGPGEDRVPLVSVHAGDGDGLRGAVARVGVLVVGDSRGPRPAGGQGAGPGLGGGGRRGRVGPRTGVVGQLGDALS